MSNELALFNARVLCVLGPQLDVAKFNAKALVVFDTAPHDISSVPTRVLTKFVPHAPNGDRTRFGKYNARVLARLSPNFRWIDVFSDIIFPHDISQNSDAATKFSTIVNEVASGHDQRIARWDYPIMEYNVAYGVRTMEQLHDLIRFFRVVKGKRNSFRFLDKLDYTSNFAELEEARAAPETTSLDQQIGIGDDETFQFQLIKSYDFDTEVAIRPIYKPITGTVEIAVNGVDVTYFSVDVSTGIVTFIPRAGPASPLLATLTLVDAGLKRYSVTVDDVPEEHLPILNVGEWVDVYGFSQDIDKATVVSSTTTEIIFTWHDAPAIPIGPEGPGPITIASNNTPRDGDVVTAGFQFHVPVRFDTDRIPVRLEYYGVGSAQEIKLVEVRPDEE